MTVVQGSGTFCAVLQETALVWYSVEGAMSAPSNMQGCLSLQDAPLCLVPGGQPYPCCSAQYVRTSYPALLTGLERRR